MRYLIVIAAVLATLSLTGCAGKMALVKGQEEVKTDATSIALLSVRVSNQYKPGHQPALDTATLSGTEIHYTGLKEGLIREETDKHKDYLLSFALKPGSYSLRSINGSAMVGYIFGANCSLTLDAPFDVKPGNISYLGHMNATIVERTKDTEGRAGIIFPFYSQTAAGFFTGTFNVSIEDRYDQDVAEYRKQFPGLAASQIEKAVLTKWLPAKEK